MLGQEIATVVDEYMYVGDHRVPFSTQALPSGIYFYRIQVGSLLQAGKMVLAK